METPLVSVVVITYNSSKYILECLDSIYKQTYQNIELIISDDCSQDDTVEKSKSWLKTFEERFVRSLQITTPINTGVPANCNRGVKECKGEWIKIIAGDDMFLPNAFQDLISNTTSDMEAVVSQYYSFTDENGIIKNKILLPDSKLYFFFCKDAHFQLRHILSKQFNITPGCYFRKTVYQKVGLYNERYPMFEDYPFFLAVANSNIKFHLIKIPTVLYRASSESISHSRDKVFNERFKECSFKFHDEVKVKYQRWWDIFQKEDYIVKKMEYHLIKTYASNERNWRSNLILHISIFLNISRYLNKLYFWYYNRK